MANKSAKGSQFERDVCTILSRWWTHGVSDSVFWRSQGSGGRAKRRSRTGGNLQGQHGDVAAVDPIGIPLIDLLTIELKRGYHSSTLMDLLDRSHHSRVQKYEEFLHQTIESWEQSGAYSWLLIVQRTRRDALILMPRSFEMDLKSAGCEEWGPYFHFKIHLRKQSSTKGQELRLSGTTFKSFLKAVTPELLQELATKV